MTGLGFIFIPLALAALLLRRPALLAIAVLAAVFQGGAVVNYVTRSGTTIPVMPYYFVCAVLVCALALEARRAARRLAQASRAAKAQLLSLLFFCLWAVTSAFFLPYYFAGLPVNPPRIGMDATYYNLVPLQFSHSNLAQAIYLPLNLCLLIFAVAIRPACSTNRLLHRAFTASTAVVLAVGFYQKAASILRWPYPVKFFVSNILSYNGRGWAEMAGGLGLRLSATFSEASYAGAFLAPAFLYFLAYAAHSRCHRGRRLLMAVLCLAALALTGSSTGYVAALFGLALFGWVEVVLPLARGRVNPATLAAAGGVLLLTAAALTTLPGSRVRMLLNGELLDKVTSGSALHRFAADRAASNIVARTAGLGAGLGSERPSSFVMYLLSNVGILGTLAFCAACVQLLLAARNRQRALTNRADIERAHALRYGFLVSLCASAIAIPDLSWQLTWVWWAMLLVSIAGPTSATGPHTVRKTSVEGLTMTPSTARL